MAFNENFVVKNGLEVASGLIYADYITNRVGIGTTTLVDTLTVDGNISGQNINISGISTFSQSLNVGSAGTIFSASSTTGFVGVGTTNPQYALDIVSTGQTALYVRGDSVITGDLQVSNITFNQANVENLNVSGIVTANSGIFTSLNVSGISTLSEVSVSDLNVSGVTTLGIVSISDLNVTGVATFSTGNATDFNATNITISGLTSSQNLLVSGITTLSDLYVSGVSTFVGIGTFSNDLYVGGKVQVASGSTSVFNGDVQFNTYLVTVGSSSSDEIIFNSVITSDLIPRLDNQYDIGSSSKKWKSINAGLGTFDNLYTTGIVTASSISIGATQIFSDTFELQNIASLDATTTATIESAIANAPNTFSDLSVTGISTLGDVLISSGIITASTGIVTYYGNGSYLTGNATNLTATIGIGTSGGVVGYGVSFLDLRGPGLSTTYYNSSVGIATIYFEGGGSGSASIGIGTTPGEAFPGIVTTGNLWYNNNLGRLFIYYSDGDSFQWVDAAPFNVGIITSLGQLNINGPLSVNGGVVVSGIVTAQDFNSLSDVNYKKNIVTIESALDKVDQLRGVKFDWKESGTPSYGVIAQELEEVLPELVHGEDPKRVNYNGIIGVLIEAIKELREELNQLKRN